MTDFILSQSFVWEEYSDAVETRKSNLKTQYYCHALPIFTS